MRKLLLLPTILAVAVMCVAIVPIDYVAAAANPDTNGWFPDFPFEQNPSYLYTVRLWVNGIQLTEEQIVAMGESSSQHVSILRYDPPNPAGATVWGLYHQELGFVLWLQRLPDQKNEQGELAQIGETAKDTYNPALTPAQNDQAGNIDWFQVGDTWYPRTLTMRTSHPGQSWSELWGPFNGVFVLRSYSVSYVHVMFEGKQYLGVKVTIVGPTEGNPAATTTEAYTFIHNVGWYERYFDIKVGNTEIFKHIATLQQATFG